MANEKLQIEVYGYDDPTVKKDVLNIRTEPAFLEEIRAPGGGNISVPLLDPKVLADPTLLDYRNVLKCRVNGNVIGAFLITKKTTKIIENTAATESYEISGEGLRTWFNDAIMFPKQGITGTIPDERTFSFASEQGTWYNAGQWVTPYNVVNWGDVVGSPWRYAPQEWPDAPNAKWIWSSNSIPTAPAGDNYFRYEFNVVTAAKYSFFTAADDYYAVYLDGQQRVATEPDATNWSEMSRLDVDLEVGAHVFAVRVTNKSGGPAALLSAIFTAGDPEVPNSAALITTTGSAGWKVAGYPNPAPGWTAGEIMLTLLEEAEDRGVRFPELLTPTFTASHDSYDEPWPRDLDWTFGIGDSYSSVVEKMEELVCDVWINPDTYELNMAITRGVDHSENILDVDDITVLEGPLIFAKGKNLQRSSVDGVGEIANSLVVQSAEGWFIANETDTDSQAKYGIMEAKLETGVSALVSDAVVDAVFSQKSNPEEGASYEIVPTPGHVPFVDFNVGDWVKAPDSRGLSVKRRVVSISVEEEEAGNPVYSVEFDTIFRDNETTMARWLEKLGGGSLGGQFANSSNAIANPTGHIFVPPPGNPPIKLPTQVQNLDGTVVGLWNINGVTPFSEVTLEWDPVTSNTDGSETIPFSYEVWAFNNEASPGTNERLATVYTNSAVLRPFDTGTEWTFTVRALNAANAVGQFSDPFTIEMIAPSVPMDAPDAPTLDSSMGLLTVNWNGLLQGSAPPPQFRYVYAMVSPAGDNTYVRKGPALQRDGRSINISDLVVGDDYDVILIAVDGLGLESAPSDVTTETIVGVDLGDLDESIQDSIDAAHDAAVAAQGTTNMLIDPSFEANDPTIWSLETADVTNQTTDPRTNARALKFMADTSAYNGSKYGHVLEVLPGEYYGFSGWTRLVDSSGVVEGGLVFTIEYGDDETTSDGVFELASSAVDLTETYEELSGNIQIPANVRFVRPVIRVEDTTGTNGYLLDDVSFRMVIPGSLIQDGAISSDKIIAGAIITGKLAAGSVATANLQAGAVTAETIAAETITGEQIAAGTITTNEIMAGTLEVVNISPSFGEQLNLEANGSIQFVVGQISDVADDLNTTNDNLDEMQTYYTFGVDGAIISKPDSPFAVAVRNDRIEMLELGVTVSYWEAGTMFVRSMVVEEVVLGNHKIEKYGVDTVVRTL